jgi:hypothetical protein
VSLHFIPQQVLHFWQTIKIFWLSIAAVTQIDCFDTIETNKTGKATSSKAVHIWLFFGFTYFLTHQHLE